MPDASSRLLSENAASRLLTAILAGAGLGLLILGTHVWSHHASRTSTPSVEADPTPVLRTARSPGVVAGRFSAASSGLASDTLPQPRPELTAEEVVRLQMRALRDNDTPSENAGIRTAFRFASPANKEATGPIENFTRLLKSERYRPMVNHLTATFGDAEVREDLARIPVRLTGPRGLRVTYLFQLTRHTTPTCARCWMTDAVVVLEAETGGEKI